MTNGNDIDQTVPIGDSVHHAPFAHSNTPKICSALQLHDARRARVCHECLDLLEDAPGELRIKVL
jgi:hypothetical protein